MSELPDDGDVIEFETVPEGSLCVPKVRYRVERKPLDREYLLVDTVSGHASRVQPYEFKRAKWAPAKQEAAVPADQADESAPVQRQTTTPPFFPEPSAGTVDYGD
jgi:hypothetical protein